MKIKLKVIHPFLLSIYPILFLFSHNINEIPTKSLLWPLIITLSLSTITWFGLSFITKNKKKMGY